MSEWFKTSERQATRSDADCEGFVWTWAEFFAPDPETDALKSVGFRVTRQVWQSVAHTWDVEYFPQWTHSNLKRPDAPAPEPAGGVLSHTHSRK